MAALSTKRQVAGRAVRMCMPVLVLAGCFYILSGTVTAQHLASLPAQLQGISWASWLTAGCFTAISLWAVGRYDGVAHAHFGTRIPDHRARWSGTIAISLAQTLGFGLITGAFGRWRLLPELSLPDALKVSAFVSFSFVVSWALVTALAILFLPGPDWAFWPALAVLAVTPAAVWIVFRYPVLRAGWLSRRGQALSLRLPSLHSAAALVIWTKLDTIAAAAAFFVLLPAEADMSFAAFLPIYLIALGAALISNTPGGVGPFEVTILSLMPFVPVSALLGSLIAFRVVYYAVPAILGLAGMLFPFRPVARKAPYGIPNLVTAPNAELGVIRQNGGYILSHPSGASAVWPTGQTLTALCDPIKGPAGPAIRALTDEAGATGRLPLIYKCNAATAVSARQMKWAVIHISDDAVLDTGHFSPDVPARRTLRRKLRAAQKAGVTVGASQAHPWHDMAAVDRQWQNTHGRARGGTMGRFCPKYLNDHFIACAYQNDRLVAFASFQRSAHEWCLDVMRHTRDMPDGTMHALVVQAIQAARADGINRLSLAATPACPDPSSAFYRWAAMQAVSRAGGPGLRQFKSTFAPRWEPRYAAARTAAGLALGLADITREVHRPAPLPAQTTRSIHNVDENYELVSRQAS